MDPEIAERDGLRSTFANAVAVRRWVAQFVDCYNGEHRHSAIRFVTLDQRHSDTEARILAQRDVRYERARRMKPERWSGASLNWAPVDIVVLPLTRRQQSPLGLGCEATTTLTLTAGLICQL